MPGSTLTEPERFRTVSGAGVIGCSDGRSADDRAPMARLLTSPRLRLALLATVLTVGTAATLLAGGPSSGEIERAVDGGGIAGPLAYIALYAALTLLLFPGAVLTAAGGAVFGTVLGTLLTVVGATIGATAAFLLGRRLGRAQIEQIAGPRVRRLDEWLARRGFTAVLYVRLVPIFPFNLLNYGAGVTGVSTRDYVLATAIGIVPGAFAFSALGSSLDDPASPEFVAALALTAALAIGGAVVARRRGRDEPSPTR
jgi:uncharacterized membrane protein YdjX (TVP38/TMEM64 family)